MTREKFRYKVSLASPDSGHTETVDFECYWNDPNVIEAVGNAARAIQQYKTKVTWIVTRVLRIGAPA